MQMPNEILLNIKGKTFSGWTEVFVEKSLFQMTGSFGLSAVDISPENTKKLEGIAMGDECTVVIDDQIIITGYIEDISISYDSTSHDIQIGGRDKTGDLIDSSFIEPANEWKGQTIIKIIRDLCNPFAITVYVDDSVTEQANSKTANDTFKANESDVIFDLILKLCKDKGILPVSYGDGTLVLTGSGVEKTNDSLELGKNIKSGNITYSDLDRFQTYIVKGQGKKTDSWSTAVAAQPSGQHTDDVIRRHRPTVVFLEGPGHSDLCKDRARWEAVNRAGLSRSIEYEIQGWVQLNGDIWPLNALVSVKDSFLKINSTLLIAALNFTRDNDSGTITRLILVDKSTFNLPPTAEPIKEIRGQFDWEPLIGRD